jgi:hypothetical protein
MGVLSCSWNPEKNSWRRDFEHLWDDFKKEFYFGSFLSPDFQEKERAFMSPVILLKQDKSEKW